MSFFADYLQSLDASDNLRHIPEDSTNKKIIDLSGNDYLGIGSDYNLRSEFFKSLSDLPNLSASASRLLASRQQEFNDLEHLLSELYGRYVLLFNSGYHANLGIISALANKNTLIVADKLVHASIIDGMLLSSTRFIRFRHNDANHLRTILDKYAADYERVLIICESVYSMDGDIAPIQEFADAKTPNSLLYVDEAHAFGVLGRNGLGLCVDMPEVDIIVGTLGKAAASIGAFIALRSKTLQSFLINTARSFIFSTALPPLNCLWSRFVIERIPSMNCRRQHLMELGTRLGRILGIETPSHIQPLIVGSSTKAIQISEILLQHGFKVMPIRRPTVPPGTERLRFSLSANLTLSQLDQLENILHIQD